MGLQDNNLPIVIKRITISEEAGHHGGAWKVAYADFVTAMMAFFLLMWLLNATTDQQRQGLADYFRPTVIRNLSDSDNPDKAEGAAHGQGTLKIDQAEPDPMEDALTHLQDQLNGIGAESMQMKNLLRHVVTRVTDEGLVIELRDLADGPLFVNDTAEPTPVLSQLTDIVARVVSSTRSQIAISGHVRSYPMVLADAPAWKLSNHRADTVRHLLEKTSLPPQRIDRVTGFADRRSLPADPSSSSNNRIEVILLK